MLCSLDCSWLLCSSSLWASCLLSWLLTEGGRGGNLGGKLI